VRPDVAGCGLVWLQAAVMMAGRGLKVSLCLWPLATNSAPRGFVRQDFRHIKSDDLDLRPVFHRLEKRVRAHVLIWMLACYLTWHLRRAWAPLTFTDQDPARRTTPSPPPAARRPPRPRPHTSTTRPGSPTTASAA
jgi:hypothetical protein